MEGRTDAAIAPTRAEDRPAIAGLLRRAGIFQDPEIKVALEVLDVYLQQEGQEDYRFLTAFRNGSAAGYTCFGKNAMTDGVFELYWIAVDPAAHRRGVGGGLVTAAETEAVRQGGRMMVAETSSRDVYRAAREFYLRMGYREVARVEDFYSLGDDKLIMVKKLSAP